MNRALALSFVLAAFPALASPPSKEVHKTLPLSADGRVAVSTYKGSVTVAAWDRAEVDVRARVEADEGCGSEATKRKWVDQTEVRIEGSTASVRIESDYDRLDPEREVWGFFGSCTSRPFVHYTLQVPRTVKLSIKDYKSALNLGPMRSEMEIDTYKGTVEITGLDGSLDLTTYKGEARVAFAHLAGSSRLDTYKGDIEVALPKQEGFDLHAATDRGGDFRSDFEVSARIRSHRWSESRVSGSVNGGGPELALKTKKGRLSLRAR